MLSGDQRTATVRATSGLEVVVLDKAQFEKIVNMLEPTAVQLEAVMKERLAHDPDM